MKNLRRFHYFLWTAAMIFIGLQASCSNSKNSETTESQESLDSAFYASQPLQSGLYDASYYEITPEGAPKGGKVNKGHFDGRIFFSLSPETSAMYVFENGNRTKIDYLISYGKPFEKIDSITYETTDTKGNPVVITTDSADYLLKFQRSGEDFTITFNPKPRYTAPALEILEKMTEQRNKK